MKLFRKLSVALAVASLAVTVMSPSYAHNGATHGGVATIHNTANLNIAQHGPAYAISTKESAQKVMVLLKPAQENACSTCHISKSKTALDDNFSFSPAIATRGATSSGISRQTGFSSGLKDNNFHDKSVSLKPRSLGIASKLAQVNSTQMPPNI